MQEPKLFPITKPITPDWVDRVNPDWVDRGEQMNWIMFVMGFLIGCVATIGMVVL